MDLKVIERPIGEGYTITLSLIGRRAPDNPYRSLTLSSQGVTEL